MSDDFSASNQSGNPNSQRDQIQQLCRSFELQWQAGKEPDIEDLLVEVDSANRLELFERLIGVEIDLCRAAGETPEIVHYLKRFPQEHRAVEAAWSADA